tara:strand:+ start:375 stop:965 length:591 start_codon:yes stop_codon:yes gene_type:complete
MRELNRLDGNDNTPLMLAAAKGNLEEVMKLISFGADPHIKDDFSMTALSRAKNLGHKHIVDYLESIMNGNEIVEIVEIDRVYKARLQHEINREKNQQDEIPSDVKLGASIFILITVLIFLWFMTDEKSKSSVETSNYEPTYNTNSYDCKLDALEIAARVKTNIRAGQSDYFYRIDLTEYKRKGCSKSHIMTAVNSL